MADLFLARVLAQQCPIRPDRQGTLGQEIVALGAVKARLSSSQRESLAAILIYAHEGRGITRSAQAEWGRAPTELSDSEMAWLLVVGQLPSCSHQGMTPERDRRACAYNFEVFNTQLSGLRSSPP